MAKTPTLTERKQRRTREAIIETAYALFAERGFNAVTVDDIAERAEVGRTTFFRYFGDKQEVLFYEEPHRLIDVESLAAGQGDDGEVSDVRSALRRLRPIVLVVCEYAVRDAARYGILSRLVEENPELRERDLCKLQNFTDRFEGILLEKGAPADVALLAAHVAIACYHASRRQTRENPGELPRAVAAAFDALIERSGSDGT